MKIWVQSFENSGSQPFLVRDTITKLCRYLVATLNGQLGLKIKELN